MDERCKLLNHNEHFHMRTMEIGSGVGCWSVLEREGKFLPHLKRYPASTPEHFFTTFVY